MGQSSGVETAQAQPTTQSAELKNTMMQSVVKTAKSLSEKPYQKDAHASPAQLQQLTYDQYRSIRYNPEKSLWHDQSLFEVQMFHPGFIYHDAVELEEISKEGVHRPIDFASNLFIYGNPAAKALVEQSPPSTGFSGFRIHFPINSDAYKDEVAVFQGASYFRLVGPGQVYGLSARGLAVDTASSNGEEFPRFTHFWLLKPTPEDSTMTVFALLDSPSVTGAFEFQLSVGASTNAEVKAVLFARDDIDKLGIAPLTSMFLFGEARVAAPDDFRPEVHDSDGLLLETADNQWIWRPLSNPKQLQVTSLMGDNPTGFGLVQRDRDFDHYQDAEARYELRPSLWVEPIGQWGKGRVELVEIPTDSETNDNIVAYWVPEQPLRKGQTLSMSYKLSTFDDVHDHSSLGRVINTMSGWGANPGSANPPPKSVRRFVVDFKGGDLDKLPSDAPIEAQVSTRKGKLKDVKVSTLPASKTRRVSFVLLPSEKEPADMQLFLTLRGKTLTEEWSYVWNPNRISQ